MSKKKRSEEDENDGNRNEWFGRLLIMAVGILIIVAGGWDYRTGILGAALFLGPLFEAPEFRLLVKVTINRVSGKQVFQVQQSHISGSNVVGSAREVHFHQAPQTVIQPPAVVPQAQPQTIEPSWDVDEEFTLEPDDYREFQFDLEEGDELVGSVEADDDVSCYVLGRLSFRSFEDGENFKPYWENEDITRTMVSFVAEAGRSYFFVVYRDEDEDEETLVSVKLRVEG